MNKSFGPLLIVVASALMGSFQGVQAIDGCPDPAQYYVDLGSNTFTPSLSGSVGWTFDIELGGFKDGSVYTNKLTVGCNVFGGSGCGLDTANGEKSTVDWTVKSPNGITPTSVPSSISFDFHKCGYQTLKCDGHTEKFPEQFPPPATGGGVLSLMVANCSSGPDTRLPLSTFESGRLETELYNEQGNCEGMAQKNTGCY